VSKSRNSMQTRRRISLFSSVLLLLCVAGCEPPGKPGAGEVSAEDVMDFPTLYATNCQGCHGVDGKNGAARILNDPLYLTVIPKDQLQETIEMGRPGTAMPAWAQSQGGPLTPKQVTALVNGIEQNWAKPVNFHGAAVPSYSGEGVNGNADNGRKLFGRDCFMCHGPGARIGSVTDASFLSLVTDQALRTSIIVGRPDFGMPDYRVLGLGHALSDQDISDLVAYLAEKRPPAVTAALVGPAPGAGNEGNKSTGSSSERGTQ